MRMIVKGFLLAGVALLLGGQSHAQDYVRIDARGLHVRKGPGTSHRVLGKANNGQALKVLARSGSWVHVRDGVRAGWVHGSFVKPIVAQAQTVTARSGLKVRSGPGVRFRQLGVLSQGADVGVLERRGNWRKIAYGESTGWVFGGYLKDREAKPLKEERPSSEPHSGATGRLDSLFGGSGSGAGSGATTSGRRPVDRPAGSGAEPGNRGAGTETEPTGEPSPRAPAGSGNVVYRRTVSDATTRSALQSLADHLGKTVVVHSGDRNSVVRGSNPGSLHIRRRAADFHVTGMSDSAVFDYMMANHRAVLGNGSFEVIIHRPGTNTGGPHLHLGNFGDSRGTHYKSERGGRYTRVSTRR